MSISTSIWVRRLFSGLVGLLALYCLLLDLSWGVWDASHGGIGYGMAGAANNAISNSAAQVFNLLHVTNSVNFLLAPIDLNYPFAAINLYALTAYVVGLAAALVWAGASKDSKELKEIDADIRRERLKKQRAGEEVTTFNKRPVYKTEMGSISWVGFQDWLWGPIIAPILVTVALKLWGVN
ncbi:hypothetical protein [Larsenimonas suaedae]|uniref:Uncharacterized protein n=1 Tax=Larsenimonas suaedae TaxID=1851019 RepID=A0ABU1GYM1_9GAMM|nr:hypothetical protein [Larsenimonas suaedae]MCM2973488.1 hypothetical protein [Larsenimonas suaedae]MDR5897143.1 hypothetical protein [Larsenimonas suaedae]